MSRMKEAPYRTHHSATSARTLLKKPAQNTLEWRAHGRNCACEQSDSKIRNNMVAPELQFLVAADERAQCHGHGDEERPFDSNSHESLGKVQHFKWRVACWRVTGALSAVRRG